MIRTRTTTTGITTATEEGRRKKYITPHPVGYARKDVFSPGTITATLTSPVTPKVGGVDGSGGDTVDVIPISK